MEISIINLNESHARSISKLISPLVEKYIFPTIDISMRHILLDSMSTENIEKYLASDYQYIGAFNEKSEIVGVAAIRGGTHLYHLFVRDDYQGNGLSRQLWQQIKYEVIDEKHPGRFTVNSSVNAESVYLKLGFQRMDGIRNRNGMVDIPMVLEPA